MDRDLKERARFGSYNAHAIFFSDLHLSLDLQLLKEEGSDRAYHVPRTLLLRQCGGNSYFDDSKVLAKCTILSFYFNIFDHSGHREAHFQFSLVLCCLGFNFEFILQVENLCSELVYFT